MTTVYGLLRDITTHTRGQTPLDLADAAGALGHAGRALRLLGERGVGRHEPAVTGLGEACDGVRARVWPARRGRLTDSMGAAADLIGQQSLDVASVERWAAATLVASAVRPVIAGMERAYPDDDLFEFTTVRAAVGALRSERGQDMPSTPALARWDRLIAESVSPDAAGRDLLSQQISSLHASVIAANQRPGGLLLAEVRAVTAVAEHASRHATRIATGLDPRSTADPWQAAPIAWNVVGRSTNGLTDTRLAERPNTPITRLAPDLIAGLRSTLEAQPAGSGDRAAEQPVQPADLNVLRRLTNQLPLIAGDLADAVQQWDRQGCIAVDQRLARPVDDPSDDRIAAILSGGRPRVRAERVDLAPLREAVHRSGDLAAGLADDLNRMSRAGPLEQPQLARLHNERGAGPASHSRLLAHAERTERAHQALRSASAPRQTPGR